MAAVKKSNEEAYRLLHEGSLALAQVERAGVRVDLPHVEKTIVEVQGRIKEVEAEMQKDEIYRVWSREWGSRMALGGGEQLAHVLFDKMGYKPAAYTPGSYDEEGNLKEGAKASTRKDALEDLELPFTDLFAKRKQLIRTINTYLLSLKREAVQVAKDTWFVYPIYNLNIASTYRSTCVARGTLIETVRDVSKYPKGVPVENVKAGDFVYCYDRNGRLTIRKVTWAGRTGRRETVRLHWVARSKRGYLDLTPDHKVRLADGRYVEAGKLRLGQDYRRPDESRHNPKIRLMALGRKRDQLYTTGRKTPVLDHRLVYKKLVGTLAKHEVVHHKDENHLNNLPGNLQKMSGQLEHARHHDSLTHEARMKGLRNRMDRHRLFGDRWKFGKEHHRYIELSKFGLLRMLASVNGRVTEIRNQGLMDFSCFERKAKDLGVDLRVVKDRYDSKGRYITIRRLKRAARKGAQCIKTRFGVNHYKAYRLAEDRGVKIRRAIYNHKIVKIERLGRIEDVYDISVEGCHNFIANELCVHNCDTPNFQNVPSRDEEMSNFVRRNYKPHPGHHMVTIDFSTLEVRIGYCYHHDPKMKKYLLDPETDMHRDAASDLFKIPIADLRKHSKEAKKTVRDSAKNQFVFPAFYGSVWFQCAHNIWKRMRLQKWPMPGNPKLKVIDHLRKKGIKELGSCDPRVEPKRGTFARHVMEVERVLWKERFKGYDRWKRDYFEEYQRRGYFEFKTGFVVGTPHKKNDVTNYPIQGSAFHCLLWCIIRVLAWLKKYKMKSKVIGQIHDSIVCSVHPRELQDFLTYCHWLMTVSLPRHWRWIDAPLEVEAEVGEIDAPWSDGNQWVCEDEIWHLKA